MKIVSLSDNNSYYDNFKTEHGLSFYMEIPQLKILFDTGASNLFAENAKELGIDLVSVDIAMISHGHNDHGGGLKTLLEINKRIKIYVREEAFEDLYSVKNHEITYIGLDKSLKTNHQIIFTNEICFINDNLILFSCAACVQNSILSSSNLKINIKGNMEEDSFKHEQNLIIKYNLKKILLTGCSHKGIINIMERFKIITGSYPDYVIGGLHLQTSSIIANVEDIENLGKELKKTNAIFYTCHCTGYEPYKILKTILKDKINYLSCGKEINIK